MLDEDLDLLAQDQDKVNQFLLRVDVEIGFLDGEPRLGADVISNLFLPFHDVFLSVVCTVTNEQNTLLSASSEQQWPTPSHRLGLKTSHET